MICAMGETEVPRSATPGVSAQRRMIGPRRPTAIMLLTLIALAALAAPAAARARHRGRPAAPTAITVLSGRPDLVVGEQALLQVSVPRTENPRRARITVGHRAVTRAFALRPGRTLLGLVSGLHRGRNLVTVRFRDGSGARITLTDHPVGGPLFAGPQVQPWTCQPGARDRHCDAPPSYRYLYRSTNPADAGLLPYDPAHPPADVATTPVNGAQVPFVVRVETGYEDRDQYAIAVLYRPGRLWTSVRPQAQFAHKMLVTHGASCNIAYAVGTTPSTTSYNLARGSGMTDSAQWALAHGWAVMSTAMDNTGHDCDVVTQAESLLMAKQRVIDRYGTLRYTIGIGCSGGSLVQQWVANAYPGIYQGLLPTCSFPDAWSSATQVFDYHLMNLYFGDSGRWGSGVSWTPAQEAAVQDDATTKNSTLSDFGFFGAIDPSHSCPGTTAADRYNATSNPGGVRCSISDFAVNVFGRRPRSEWGPQERALGHGFAGLPVDNIGVQYGLAALRAGTISPAQFVDLNAKLGGVDPETIAPIPHRNVADPFALAAAYRSGMIDEANHLGQVAIIDCRGPNPDLAHDAYRAFAVRARLDRANRTHANQLIWEGPVQLIASTACQQDALQAMDGWLGRVSADHRTLPLNAKIIRDRPQALGDRCYDAAGGIQSTHALCPPGVVPLYGTPRMVAGDPITTDANKCRLQPLRRTTDGVGFTGAQWAQLQQIFPAGVCDYTQPGVDQQPTIAWQTYQTPAGRVIPGGRPMPPAPVSVAFASR